jgi:polar amino acid transport system substrate-binding protein
LNAIGRLLLPAVGGVLVLLALLVHARGQTAPSVKEAAPKSKVRILAVNAPPLAEEHSPGGGLVLALLSASLGRAGQGAAPESTVRWAKDVLTADDINDATVDFSLPVESANCDRPNELTQTSAVLCDNAVYSDPIFQVVLRLFSLTSGSFKFDTDDNALGKTICLSRDHDASALNANGRNWVSYKRVTVLRRQTMLDCIAAVQAHDADAFVSTDLEGTHLLRQLGLAPFYTMQARPLAARGVHAVVSRQHPRSTELINDLNKGLKRLKEGDAYAVIVQRHLAAAAALPPPVPKPAVRKPAPLPPVAAAPAPSPKLPAPLAQPPAALVKPQVPDHANRETAL